MEAEMAKKPSYSDLLKDPRWQRRRLEILSRDEWVCRSCGSGEATLHVHHRRYESGKSPWDYKDQDLITLCSECHSYITRIIGIVKELSLIHI